jgi:hypothetical protein
VSILKKIVDKLVKYGFSSQKDGLDAFFLDTAGAEKKA